MGSFNTFHKKALPEMALAFLVYTVKNLWGRYTLRSVVRAQARKFLTGSPEKPYHRVSEVEDWADCIMEIFLKNRKNFPK